MSDLALELGDGVELSTAKFSDDGLYRYDLTRRWGDGPLALWLMLNPSTADATQDDPTIRRCIGFAKREGMGGLVVCNLFALRSTDPDALLKVSDPVGPDNGATIDGWLRATEVELAVAAWGSWWANAPTATRPSRTNVEAMASNAGRELRCLGLTQAGEPRHPLYVRRVAELELYARAW